MIFDLEQSIAQWRRQMLTARIELSTLTELESHLREEIGNQIKSGQSPQTALETAIKSMGRGVELKKEFKKAGAPLAVRMVKLMSIGCGAISFMFSLWVLRFLFSEIELIPIILGLIAVATSYLFWKYSYKFLPAIHHEIIRATIGFASCIASVIWIQLFSMEILPGLIVHPPGMEVAEGRLVTAILWACTAMAILSGIGYGLEKAASGRETANS